MDIGDWLLHIGFAALMGMAGQFGRAVIGLKKMAEENRAKGLDARAGFVPGQLVTTLFIGALAGLLAMLLVLDPETGLKPTKELVIGLMAAGYAGADFIEGALGRLLPGADPARAAPVDAGARALAAPEADIAPQSLEELMARHYGRESSYAPLDWVKLQPGADEAGWR